MSVRLAACVLLLVSAGAPAVGARGATPAENARFADQLAAYMKPVFAKKAPGLALGKVTCVLPESGVVVACRAHFTNAADGANVVYGIRATRLQNGAVRWTTTWQSCTDAASGKSIAC